MPIRFQISLPSLQSDDLGSVEAAPVSSVHGQMAPLGKSLIRLSHGGMYNKLHSASAHT